MLEMNKKNRRNGYEKEIDRLLNKLSLCEPGSDEYSTLLGRIDTLSKADSYKPARGISADTVLVVGGNLLGIALILGYEKVNVVTSKALSFVLKGRV